RWALVWAGEVPNGTFGARGALSLPRSRSRASAPRPPRPGRLLSMGPPRAAGRWSLVAELVGEAGTPTERGHATAVSLLERHGVVTREAVMAENLPGGSPPGNRAPRQWRRPAPAHPAISLPGWGRRHSASRVR